MNSICRLPPQPRQAARIAPGCVLATILAGTALPAFAQTPPIAEANGPYAGVAGQSVSFSGGGSQDPDGGAITFDWDFGDGGSSTEANPSHTYDDAGSYTVTLTVTDQDGDMGMDGAPVDIEAANVAPTADAGGPYTGTEGVPVSFDGSGSGDSDGTISYAWNFGDGGSSNQANPSHAYTSSGSYTVTLTVTDNDGAMDMDSAPVDIEAANVAPTAQANGPYSGEVDESIAFSSSGSGDSDGSITYDWDFGDGGSSSQANPSHAYTSPGSYTVTLTVTDNDGATDVDTASAAVNAPPTADAGGPYAGTEGESVSFDGSGSADSDGTLTYDWDFGDGASGSGVSPSHIYAADGSYTVTLTVTDDDGAADTDSTTATIDALPEAGNDSYSTDEDQTRTVGAPGVLGNDSDDDPLTAVSFTQPANGSVSGNPDGSFVYTPNPNFNGIDTFTYRADNGAALSDPATVTITVNPVNDSPVAFPESYTVNEDTTLSRGRNTGVLGNDTDIDGDSLRAMLVEDALNGSLDLNPNGSFSYTPDANFHGSDRFRYQASDGDASSETVTVDITIHPVNDAPAGGPIGDRVATENVLFSLQLQPSPPLFTDVEGDPILFQISPDTPLPDGLELAGTEISGVPALETSVGDFMIDLIVSDGEDSLVSRFTISVLMAGRADLALRISAAPGPALINESATWTYEIENRSAESVANVVLDAAFSGEVPFSLGTPPAGCSISAPEQLTCTAGPVLGGSSIAVQVSGTSSQAGDVLSAGAVQISDPVPIDETPENDSATGTLNVAQRVSAGAALKLSAAGSTSSDAADLNGDGFVDLVVSTEAGGSSFIIANVVDPANEQKRALSEAFISLGDQGPGNAVAAADLDGDGAPEIVTANGPGAANQIFVNLNPGDGGFAFELSPSELGSPADDSRALAIGDMDGISGPDIVFANGSPNAVFLSTGDLSFAPPIGLGDEDSVDVVLVDLVGDPLPDLVFANADGDATIYRNTGGSFAPEPDIPTGPTTSVAAGDFDGDGDADLVFGRGISLIAGGAPSNLLMLNTTVEPAVSFSPAGELGASPTVDVLVQDVDDDFDVDIIVINSTGGHQIYVNNGNGQFTLHPEQFASPEVNTIVAGKLSVDDRIDVAVTGTAGTEVFFNDGRGNLGAGDVDLPTIQLQGNATVDLTVDSGAYTDAGATAADPTDGDLTENLVVDNPVDPAVVGTYTVTYTVHDSSGNAAVPVTRTVTVGVNAPSGGGGGSSISPWLAGLLALLAGLARSRRRPANASVRVRMRPFSGRSE